MEASQESHENLAQRIEKDVVSSPPDETGVTGGLTTTPRSSAAAPWLHL